MTEIVVRVCLTAEVVPEVPEAVPAEEETARIEEVAVPASDVVEAAVAAAVPAAPEAAPIEEAAAPVTEVMVAVSADATPAEEEVSIEETTAPVIDVAAPEVVPSAPALDAAGLSVCVCARACVCVHVCVCVCVCVRVHMHESESFSFSFRYVPVSLSLLFQSLSFACTAKHELCLTVKTYEETPVWFYAHRRCLGEDCFLTFVHALSLGSHPLKRRAL